MSSYSILVFYFISVRNAVLYYSTSIVTSYFADEEYTYKH